jgi:hypothetical protein
MKPLVTMRRALSDDGLLGLALPGPSWLPWRVVLMAARGEPLAPEELEIFVALTGRNVSPTHPVEELCAIAGRRGGKSRALSTFAVYIGALCDHSEVLASGERGLVSLLAPTQRQSRIDLGYCDGIITQSPELRQLVVNRTTDTLSLSNGIDIEVRSANFRMLRGVTCVAVLADEVAFFSDESSESANPDTEILNAVRPSLATTNGPLLIASSPYRKLGTLWDIYRQNFGPEGDPGILVLKGTSRQFNPSLDQKVVDRAFARDPASARAEYGAEFRDDIESYVSREVIEACIEPGVRERAPSRNHRYHAFVDPAGGSGNDSMTLSVGHLEDDVVVLDALREQRPPFSPDATIADFARLLRTYGVKVVTGDRFGGEFPRELFRSYGIQYRLSELTKNGIYIEALPRLNSKTVRLLHNERLVSQLAGLERRHGRTGRDTIDHGPHGHDDVANATMGLCVMTSARQGEVFVGSYGEGGPIHWQHEKVEPKRLWRRRFLNEAGQETDKDGKLIDPPPKYA